MTHLDDLDAVLPPRISLDEAELRTGIPKGQMIALAKRGKFPAILRPTQRIASVAIPDLVAWISENSVDPRTENARDVFRRQVASSPFRADMKAPRQPRKADAARALDVGTASAGRILPERGRAHDQEGAG